MPKGLPRASRAPSSSWTVWDGHRRTAAPLGVAAVARLIEALPGAALLLGADRVVLLANGRAHRLLDAAPFAVDRFGRLAGSDPTADAALEAALAAAAQGRGRQVARIQSTDGGEALVAATALPLVAGAAGVSGVAGVAARGVFGRQAGASGAVLVEVSPDGASESAALAGLEAVFGLSEEEARAARAIEAGLGAGEFAQRLGTDAYSASLLRAQLTERLGAHRGSDVARIVGVLAALTPDGPAGVKPAEQPADALAAETDGVHGGEGGHASG